jgi:ubiquinone/menaquinone biosynthesis C-methylase UbiE
MQANEADGARRVVIQHFETNASYWANVYEKDGVKERIYQDRLRIAQSLVASVRLPVHSRVLEVGCGAGLATVELAQMGFHVQSIDSCEVMVRATSDRVRRAHVDRKVNCGLGDVGSLAFPDCSFSLVLALGVLPWLPAIRPAIDEMSRVLVPGGYLIASVDSRWGLNWFLEPLSNPLLQPAKRLAMRALRRSSENAGARVYRNSRRECNAALTASGLRKRAGMTFGFGPFTFLRYDLVSRSFGFRVHNRLQHLVERGFPFLRGCGAQYIVMAQKCNQ